jgi:hypothetical protein
MNDSRKPRSTFARIFIGLAILFVISLGLCGMNGFAGSLPESLRNNEVVVAVVLVVEIGGLLVSVLGFFITGIVWLIVRAASGRASSSSARVAPREDSDQDGGPK